MNSLIDLLQQEILIIPDINGDGLAHRETPRSPLDWLHHWLQTTCRAPDTPQVPPEACVVTTPLALSAWCHMLISHPHRSLVHFFLQGIATGFKVGYDYIDLYSTQISQAEYEFSIRTHGGDYSISCIRNVRRTFSGPPSHLIWSLTLI